MNSVSSICENNKQKIACFKKILKIFNTSNDDSVKPPVFGPFFDPFWGFRGGTQPAMHYPQLMYYDPLNATNIPPP